MVAFLALSPVSPEAVDAAYNAGIAKGGTDEGEPGLRDNYGKGYYGAYLRDLDGNKVHLVYRGDIEGSTLMPLTRHSSGSTSPPTEFQR